MRTNVCRTGEANPNYRHGLAGTRVYRIWGNVLSRCTNPNVPAYDRYGARGVTVCDRWLTFENFLADMGQPPSADHTIEREDNMRGYEPGNCVWLHKSLQAQHRDYCVDVTIGGVTKNRSVWCREYGIALSTVRNRVQRSGWTWAQAITTPVG